MNNADPSTKLDPLSLSRRLFWLCGSFLHKQNVFAYSKWIIGDFKWNQEGFTERSGLQTKLMRLLLFLSGFYPPQPYAAGILSRFSEILKVYFIPNIICLVNPSPPNLSWFHCSLKALLACLLFLVLRETPLLILRKQQLVFPVRSLSFICLASK